MAFASEELMARGAPRRSALSGDDEYLRQLNMMTQNNIESIRHAGDAIARSEENKWQGINQGINNAFDTYRDVKKQQRQEGREDAADKMAAEDRAFNQNRLTKSDTREEQKLSADLGQMEQQKKLTNFQIGQQERQNQFLSEETGGVNPATGQKLTREQQNWLTQQDLSKSQLDATKQNIATSQLQNQATKLDIERAQKGDRIADAKVQLKNALSSGDPQALNKVRANIVASGGTMNEALQAEDLAKGELAAAADKRQMTLLMDEGYKDTAGDVAKTKVMSDGLVALKQEIQQYQDNLKFGGVKEDSLAKSSVEKFASVLENYFGDKAAADELRKNWTTYGNINDMTKVLAAKEAQVNNRMKLVAPAAQRFSGSSYLQSAASTIKQNVDWKPNPESQGAQVMPIWSATPAASAPQMNQQMVNQYQAAQPQMNGAPIRVGIPSGPPMQGAPPPPPGQPAMMPDQPHPMRKFQRKQ